MLELIESIGNFVLAVIGIFMIIGLAIMFGNGPL